MKQVFISYPRDNAAGQATARSLHTALQKEQISSFLDETSIDPGTRWLVSLKEGVANCKIMLSVISSSSDDRVWFEKEFNEAQKYDIYIIPVLAEEVELPMQFSDLQAIFLFGAQVRDQQEKLFKFIRKYLGVDEINPLIKQAIHAKRTEAYEIALEKWHRVLDISPNHSRATNEIHHLQKLNDLKNEGAFLSQQLVLRFLEIQSVFTDVALILNQAAKRVEAPAVIEITKQFLEKHIIAEDYIQQCQLICKPAGSGSTASQAVNYDALAQRISKGEMVLFLGSDIAGEYGDDAKSEQQLASELAQEAKYKNFQGSLSSIVEYLRLTADYGASGVWKKLEVAVSEVQVDNNLYPLLARIEAPLILISAAYDDQLEKCFQESRKPYVQLSSIVSRSDEYDIGHVIASYSDKSKPDQAYLAENLSALKLHENGYSIIYKIRGSCVYGDEQSLQDKALQRDALTVAESDYFTFARHAEKIIPSYLAGLLRGRGFLFVGYSPASWEQRLLVSALLSKRTHASDQCYTVGGSKDPLESAYWKKQHVHSYDVNLLELDGHIEEALL